MILAQKKKAKKTIRARWAAQPSSEECPKRMEVSLASAPRIETLFYRETQRFVCMNRGAGGPLEVGAPPSPSKGVIPKARVFSSGPRDLAWSANAVDMFICHRHREPFSDKENTMRKPKQFFVYIMTNRPRSHVLYTGITN